MVHRTTITHEVARLRKAGRPRVPVPMMPWAAEAACQSHDPEQWMDDQPGRPTAAAKAVCAACPVRAACLAHALAYDEPWGIWGGLTTRERAARRLGLPLGDDELRERAVQRYIEGQGTLAGIAKELGVSPPAVRKWVRAARRDLAS